jgi:hypothetical protein
VMPPRPLDDASISGADHLYRRIPPSQAPYNENRRRRWPSSAALLPSSDDDNEVSVYLGSALEEHGLDPMDVLEGHEDYGLICFPVSSARAAGYGIRRDPVLNSKRPLRVDAVHAVLTGTPLTSKQKRKPARTLLDDDRLVVIRDPVGCD